MPAADLDPSAAPAPVAPIDLPPARLASPSRAAALRAHARHFGRRARALARPLATFLAIVFVLAYLFGRVVFFLIETAIRPGV